MNTDIKPRIHTNERESKQHMKAGKMDGVDWIDRAYRRERAELRWPVWQSEVFWRPPSQFKCVCCGRSRRDEERREPRSEVCLRCVEAAGYLN
jgi:hypothetical protein